MPEAYPEALAAAAEAVRKASQDGKVVRLSEISQSDGTEGRILADALENPEFADIKPIPDGEEVFLYSDLFMTHSYAAASVRAASGDHCRILAETIRSESAVYPRPTPLTAFLGAPFFLSPEEVKAAAEKMCGDAQYGDICSARASNGDVFFFSLNHLDRARAEPMAEWLAVGQFENP